MREVPGINRAMKKGGELEIRADWDRPFFCQTCDKQLTLTKFQRTTKFCHDCSKIRQQAQQKEGQARYLAKQRACLTV